jgi:hypothetical protein
MLVTELVAPIMPGIVVVTVTLPADSGRKAMPPPATVLAVEACRTGI